MNPNLRITTTVAPSLRVCLTRKLTGSCTCEGERIVHHFKSTRQQSHFFCDLTKRKSKNTYRLKPSHRTPQTANRVLQNLIAKTPTANCPLLEGDTFPHFASERNNRGTLLLPNHEGYPTYNNSYDSRKLHNESFCSVVPEFHHPTATQRCGYNNEALQTALGLFPRSRHLERGELLRRRWGP